MSNTIAMADEFAAPKQDALIKVCGIGGGGGNAVARMIEADLGGVEFIAINTDAQDLRRSPAGRRLQIGGSMTGGLGAGAKPDVGRRAAEEDRALIEEALKGADMVFLTAGLGGGTGTGATPVIAEVAQSTGALTVAIVTLPFTMEGHERKRNATEGLKELEKHVDALIIIPNDRLAELTQDKTFLSAFEQADEVLHNGVRAVSEIITVPGLVNVDFADVNTIMREGGRTLMGIGTAEGEGRAIRAVQEAIICPLLEQSTIDGAGGVIVNIRGGRDIGMREVHDAMSAVRAIAAQDANIIFGAVVDDNERPDLQVTVIASRFPKTAVEKRPEAAHQPTAAPEVRPVAAPAAASEPREPQRAFVDFGADAAPKPPPAPPRSPDKGLHHPAPGAAQPVKKREEVREPIIQDLFALDEEPEPGNLSSSPDDSLGLRPEEDSRIPTYMRKRMKMQKETES